MLNNYIDEYVVQQIESKFEIEKCKRDLNFRQNILLEINDYLNEMQAENIKALSKKGFNRINTEESFSFFRSQERIEQTKRLIQYLYSFLKEMPKIEKIKDDIINPFDQLKSFIFYNVNLLAEDDVKLAICREYNDSNKLTETNQWYYQGRIEKAHQILKKTVQDIDKINVKNLGVAFDVIRNLSLFWFSIKNLSTKTTRRSDKYLYILSCLLLDKIKSQ